MYLRNQVDSLDGHSRRLSWISAIDSNRSNSLVTCVGFPEKPTTYLDVDRRWGTRRIRHMQAKRVYQPTNIAHERIL